MSKMYEALQYAYTEQDSKSRERLVPPLFVEKPLEKKEDTLPPVVRTLAEEEPVLDYGNAGLSMEPEMLQLHQSITSLLPDTQSNILQFIGSHSGVGTSSILREYGKVIAKQYGKSVLLIDVDFQPSSSQHQAFGVHPREPLQSLMQNGGSMDSVITRVEQTRISLSRFADNRQSNLHVSTSHTDYRRIWEFLRKQFDLILIDSPPLGSSVDSLALSAAVDGVVMVVEAEKTRSPIILTLKDRIIRRGGRVLGVAFNKQRHYIPGWAYRWL
ncbi:MAG: CpsD/CapB family tyrosine-protein kinase [Nitrospirales bacterium]|nr:CpsD/CapB family tyrosine-protein kinase [Nitrospira sp.]MDR4502679.1 CpsD/CapB family tyrosine-protein kinase [Nitrospirales bacterium]